MKIPPETKGDLWELIPIAIGKPPTRIFHIWINNLYCNIIYPGDARLIWQKSINENPAGDQRDLWELTGRTADPLLVRQML